MVASKYAAGRAVFASLVLSVAALASQVAAGEEVLLAFSSPTCGPCQQMRPIVQRLIDEGYPIQTIDASRETPLTVRFQVERVPRFVMLIDDREIDSIEGAVDREALLAMFHRAGYPEQTVRGQASTRPPLGSRLRGFGRGSSQQTPPNRALPPATPTGAPAAPAGTIADTLAHRLIEASVRIEVRDATGQSHGTGTIIESQPGSALVLTCGHLFRESQGKSPVTVDLFRLTPTGPQVAASVPGEVISYDLERDVGLVRIQMGTPLPAVEVATPSAMPQPGDSVASIGCDHGGNPTVRGSRVTTVDRYTGPSNIETTGAPVEGRSGGGLFNAQGQLIGVCFAADERGNEGLYSGLPSIHQELRRMNTTVGGGAAGAGAAPTMADEPLRVANAAIDHRVPDAPAPSAPVRPEERAILQEIVRRSAGGEVIFIIRPKNPGEKSQILTLDAASPEFIARLMGAAQAASELPSREVLAVSHRPRATAGPQQRPVAGRAAGVRQASADPEGWSNVR